MELAKRYDAKTTEPKLRVLWEKKGTYAFDVKSDKPIYSIDTPPPTLSGRMHIGHSFSYSQQDYIARYKRMRGFNVFFPFGTDDNGLATEKLVQKSRKLNLRNLPREDAIKVCLDYLKEERPKFIQDWKDLGISCDYSLTYSTINEHARKIAQKSFLDLVKKKLAYRKEGPIMWDRVFQTAIAQAELEGKTQKSTLNFVKAKLDSPENTYIIYATTRPELLYGCVGVSLEDSGDYVTLKINNEYWITGKNTYQEKFKDFDYEVVGELKGKDLIGKKVTVPLSNNEVKIDHDASVKADFGTGIVYFCTYGGLDCVEWMSQRPHIKPIDLLHKNGKLNQNNGPYEGLLTNEARKKIIEDLNDAGVLIKKEAIEHVVNVGERSGAEIEYIVSKQWYIKYLDKKEDFLVNASQLNWFPKFMRHRVDNWIKGLNWDWSISRQRHFGIPIPAWYDKEGNIYYADESQLPVDPTKDRPLNAPKNIELIPETDVFDTWFTSASSPFIATELDSVKSIKDKLFPMDLRPQAHDIINFWLFYTMAKTRLLKDVNPWKDVTISGFVLDPKGNKMSKSKGNVVAPQDVVEKYSADALRYWAAGSKLGEDMPYQEKDIQTGHKTVNKLWNASKFVFMHIEDYEGSAPGELFFTDKWLLSKLQHVIKEATDHFEEYEFAKAKMAVDDFFWNTFCDYYLEIIKERLYNAKGDDLISAKYVLHRTLIAILKMYAPIMPHITEEIYSHMNKTKSIHLSVWPEYDQTTVNTLADELGNNLMHIIAAVRKKKSSESLSLKVPVNQLIIACLPGQQDSLKKVLSDIKSVTNAQSVVFEDAEEFSVVVEV